MAENEPAENEPAANDPAENDAVKNDPVRNDPPTATANTTAAKTSRPASSPVSKYLIPLATSALLGVCFFVYYLYYVQQHREYLLSRNYRVLAMLSQQLSDTLANAVSTLDWYIRQFDDSQFVQTKFDKAATYKYTNGTYEPVKNNHQALNDHSNIDGFREEVHSFAPRLSHLLVRHIDKKPPEAPGLIRQDGAWSFQLTVFDSDGDHEANATIKLEDLARSFSPSIIDTFDDVLLARADSRGEVIYQKQKSGAQFSSLSLLLKNSTLNASGRAGSGGEDAGSGAASNPLSNLGPEHLVQVELAGILYDVFLEPLTVDLNPLASASGPNTQHLVFAGLVPSKHFGLQSFAIPYRTIVLFSSAFLLLCLSTPVIKMLFFNERERIRLRELLLIPFVFVALASVLTFLCLQTIYFEFRHGDTDSQLERLSERMSGNIRDEITAMRTQLEQICRAPQLLEDRSFPALVVRTNVLTDASGPFKDEAVPYPYFSNIFWTSSGGHQLIKWSTGSTYTPLIDVGGLDFFESLNSEKRLFFLREKEAFRLDSVLPPNQDDYVAVMGIRAQDCIPTGNARSGEFLFLTAKPLSLIEPVLPLGFSFALLDDTGKVLFHSDRFRNNRENFLVESGNDHELMASLYGHSNTRNFSFAYRGEEVRARVVPVAGVTAAPWSLVVYRDARYEQTYNIEVLTMGGMLLLCYLAFPTVIAIGFYFFIRPEYMPAWLWPSEGRQETYRFQIAAGLLMLLISTALIIWRPIEESLYAAAAAGYVTLIVIFWTSLDPEANQVSNRSRWAFTLICGSIVLLLLAFAVHEGWWWSAPISLILLPFALALRGARPLMTVFRWFPELPYRLAYTIRTLVLLTVIGILPAISFFQNSLLLESRLYVRAAQLHAAAAWNARAHAIENLEGDSPGLFQSGKVTENDRCNTSWDNYLDSYFNTVVKPSPHRESGDWHKGEMFDAWFLDLAHYLHHSYNDIGAEALGVLRNPSSPNFSLPEAVYANKTLVPSLVSDTTAQRDMTIAGEWEWLKDDSPVRLRLHQGSADGGVCATKDEPDLIVSSSLPDSPVSMEGNMVTGLLVIAVIGILFRLVTRRVCLFDVHDPVTSRPDEVRKILQGPGNCMVLVASDMDWSASMVSGAAPPIDLRTLSADPSWGEKFDAKRQSGEGPIIIEHFDWGLSNAASNRQRLILLEKLLGGKRKVIAVSAVDPFPIMVERGDEDATGDDSRWPAVMSTFTRVSLARGACWPNGETVKAELPGLWAECAVQPELHKIAGEILDSCKAGLHAGPEQVVSEVQERASEYYYMLWRSSTREERFLLYRLAEDGMVNTRNTASLRQLLRRGLILRRPQLRLMNESFRRFLLAAPSNEMRSSWSAEAASSGWGKARGAVATGLVLVGIFLLATQQQFLQTSTGLLTAAGGGVAALLKLVEMVQERHSNS